MVGRLGDVGWPLAGRVGERLGVCVCLGGSLCRIFWVGERLTVHLGGSLVGIRSGVVGTGFYLWCCGNGTPRLITVCITVCLTPGSRQFSSKKLETI